MSQPLPEAGDLVALEWGGSLILGSVLEAGEKDRGLKIHRFITQSGDAVQEWFPAHAVTSVWRPSLASGVTDR
jgi:hypothetical protein